MKEHLWLRVLVVVFGLALIGLLLVFPYQPSTRVVKSPETIYQEADYLAHIDVIYEFTSTKQEAAGYGSGIVIFHKNQYYILTAGHMDPERPDLKIKSIRFVLKGQSGHYTATFYKVDHLIDAAILQIDKVGDSDFTFVGRLPKFGHSSDLKVGETVYSLGSPLGHKFTFGDGSVKNLNQHTAYWHSAILHNAGIAEGSSGGPLLNKYGEVIGMNVGTYPRNPNFCIATYIDDVLAWLESLD